MKNFTGECAIDYIYYNTFNYEIYNRIFNIIQRSMLVCQFYFYAFISIERICIVAKWRRCILVRNRFKVDAFSICIGGWKELIRFILRIFYMATGYGPNPTRFHDKKSTKKRLLRLCNRALKGWFYINLKILHVAMKFVWRSDILLNKWKTIERIIWFLRLQ